jgi:phage tail-like protein
MPDRDFPYGAFNFQVRIQDGPGGQEPQGGFSDVSGIGQEFLVAEYRNGNDPENHVRKVVGLHKVSDVTLKRGLIDSRTIWDWIDAVRTQGSNARRQVTIALFDESGQEQQSWTLQGCVPMKWTGPTLAAKAHGDVAMEELTLSCEGIVRNP